MARRQALASAVVERGIGLDWWVRRWLSRSVSGHGVLLREGRDLGRSVEVLTRSLGGRAGIDAVLADLDRSAVVVDVPATAADYGFRWDDEDFTDEEWWPQGITTSADASDLDDISGRKVIVVAWYAKRLKGLTQGVRLTFVDVTDEAAPCYRHVLLVEPVRRRWSRRVTMKPVPVHAGGIIWYGPSMLVADTRGGIRTFEVDDICRVAAKDGWRGYRYVLPQRTSYSALNDRGVSPFKFSFVSLDRSGDEHQLVAGEYGKTTGNRLVRFSFDAGRAALALEDGAARPLELLRDQPAHMQGAAVVSGTYYITTSRGDSTPGSLWVRGAGAEPHELPGVLAIGCEDLTYWPQRDQLWNCSEYPGKRYVYALLRSQFGPPDSSAPRDSSA